MPLPKLNSPTYELILPSSNRKVKYRPFLVKEEKILLIAMESEDEKQMQSAVKQILKNCILTRGIKVEKMSTFDIEYLFLNVRGKSVGENVEVNIICPDDGETQVQTIIDIDSIKVQKNKNHNDTVKLDDEISIKLKYPSLTEFIQSNFDSDDTTDVDTTMHMIASCIDIIYNDEESWKASESTPKEIQEFIDQLNTKQFKMIENFFNTMPKLSHTVKVKNPKTEVESEVVLEGLASFFN